MDGGSGGGGGGAGGGGGGGSVIRCRLTAVDGVKADRAETVGNSGDPAAKLHNCRELSLFRTITR